MHNIFIGICPICFGRFLPKFQTYWQSSKASGKPVSKYIFRDSIGSNFWLQILSFSSSIAAVFGVIEMVQQADLSHYRQLDMQTDWTNLIIGFSPKALNFVFLAHLHAWFLLHTRCSYVVAWLPHATPRAFEPRPDDVQRSCIRSS